MPDFKERMLALLAAGRHPIRAEAPSVKGDDITAVLRLYDPVDSWGGDFGISAKEFAAVLDELPDTVETLEVHINSPGGEVTEGLAILNLLRQHKARYVAVVDGVAASSASFIAAGADELVMAPNSELFVHRAWGLVVGNADDMTKFAAELDHLDRNLASIYAKKAGGDVDEWLAAMSTETWYSAEEAVAAGLADRVDEAAPDGAKAKATVDLSIFNTAGRKAGQQPSATLPSPSPVKGQKGGSMPELTPEHLALLGLTEDASAEDIQAKLTELATPPEPPETPALPDGVVAIDAAQLAELRNNAQAGVEARAEQLRAQRELLVNAAVSDGRIAPARRDHWLAQLEADPGAEAVLGSLEKGLIPLAAKGTEANDLETDDERAYDALFGKEVAS